LNQGSAVQEAVHLVKSYAPVFPIKEMFLHIDTIRLYLSTTVSTAISIAFGTIQCVESAKRAGDFFPTRESMFVDGIGTLTATFFGSFFSMTGNFEE
jgi:AGZA family xanthine/uracil permease-like MFS transporter